jgi:hypothetical protein
MAVAMNVAAVIVTIVFFTIGSPLGIFMLLSEAPAVDERASDPATCSIAARQATARQMHAEF